MPRQYRFRQSRATPYPPISELEVTTPLPDGNSDAGNESDRTIRPESESDQDHSEGSFYSANSREEDEDQDNSHGDYIHDDDDDGDDGGDAYPLHGNVNWGRSVPVANPWSETMAQNMNVPDYISQANLPTNMGDNGEPTASVGPSPPTPSQEVPPAPFPPGYGPEPEPHPGQQPRDDDQTFQSRENTPEPFMEGSASGGFWGSFTPQPPPVPPHSPSVPQPPSEPEFGPRFSQGGSPVPSPFFPTNHQRREERPPSPLVPPTTRRDSAHTEMDIDHDGPGLSGRPTDPAWSPFNAASRDDIVSLRNCIQELTHEVSGMVRNTSEILQQQSTGNRRTSRRRDPVDSGDDSDADDEDTIPSRRKTGPIRHRRRSQNKLSRDVKFHTKLLLEERISTLPAIPTIEEVEDWNPRRRKACTAEDFRPDLNAPPGTPWNKSVTQVFVQSFLDADVYQARNAEAIRLAFVSHLKSLRRAESLKNMGRDAREKIATKARRDERKRNLFHRRLAAAKSHNSLCPHVQMLMYLGVDGMSTDESDHESATDGQPRYRIIKKAWRHPNLASWLRVFDALHQYSRFRPVRRITRGAQVRTRLPSNRIDGSRAAVPQLPTNAYNPGWLMSLHEFDREILRIDEEPYDYSHTPEVHELAQANGA